MKPKLMLTACVVILKIICAQPNNRVGDQAETEKINGDGEILENFQNLFNSIAKEDTRNSEIYRDVLQHEVARKRQAFDDMKDEIQEARSKKFLNKKNFHIRSKVNESVVELFKRQVPPTQTVHLYPTRWPYPHKPVETDWSAELKTRPSYHISGHHEIDAIFTGIINTVSKGDRQKKAQLTLYHEWFPIEASNCFDRIRDLVTQLCVDWRWNPYAQKFSYILINMCNADWLNPGEIEEHITKSCKKRSIVEDMEK